MFNAWIIKEGERAPWELCGPDYNLLFLVRWVVGGSNGGPAMTKTRRKKRNLSFQERTDPLLPLSRTEK